MSKLASCPACKKKISIAASNCLNCADPLEEGWIEESETEERAGSLGRLALVLAPIFLIWLIGIVSGSKSSGSGSASSSSCGDKYAAFDYSEILVKRRLKSPSTADFASMNSSKVARLECGIWWVRSYVNSQNSLGANIRTDFIAKVKYDPSDDSWALIEFNPR
jgi:hypothetical protein